MFTTFRRRSLCLIVIAIALLVLSSSAIGQNATITIKCDEEAAPPVPPGPKTSKKKQRQDASREPGAKLDLPGAATKTSQTSSLTLLTLAIGCTATATVRVTGGPPNQTLVYSMVQTNPANIIGFKWNAGDPVTPSLQVPVQLDATGFGISNVFLIKGVLIGQTTTYGQGAGGLLTDTADLSIIACNCPPIPVITPTRN